MTEKGGIHMQNMPEISDILSAQKCLDFLILQIKKQHISSHVQQIGRKTALLCAELFRHELDNMLKHWISGKSPEKTEYLFRIIDIEQKKIVQQGKTEYCLLQEQFRKFLKRRKTSKSLFIFQYSAIDEKPQWQDFQNEWELLTDFAPKQEQSIKERLEYVQRLENCLKAELLLNFHGGHAEVIRTAENHELQNANKKP